MNWLPAVIAYSCGWAVPLVQYVLRPSFGHHQGPVGVLLGSAPDLIVGFCLPFTLLQRPSSLSREAATKLFWLSSAITIAAILYDEYASPIGPNVFDPNDLLFGIGGTVLAAAVYFLFIRNRLHFSLE